MRYVIFAVLLLAWPCAAEWADSPLVWWLLVLCSSAVTIGAVRFPAAWSDAHRFDASDADLLAAAKDALHGMNVRWNERPGGGLRAKVSMSLSSWGERMELQIRDGLVECESRCVLGLVDWGKNKKNVTGFFSSLADVPGAVPPMTPQEPA